MLGYLKRLFQLYQPPESPPEVRKPIFVVGCGRSGTTMLFNILKQHPQLAPTTGYPDGEDHVGWIKHGKCTISGLGSRASIDGGHTGFDYCLYMDENDLSPEVAASMKSYYFNDVMKRNRATRAVNKNPHLSNKLRYVRAIFPDAKFVHIVRDCLPVVSSWIKIMEDNQPHQVLYWPDTKFPCLWVIPAPPEGKREEIFRNEDRIFPGGGSARVVDYWSEVNSNIPIQLEDSTEQLYTVKYEDLCMRPAETLKRICDFCEVEDFSEVPIEIKTDTHEKYKSHLTKEQINDFNARAYETRKLFGYV